MACVCVPAFCREWTGGPTRFEWTSLRSRSTHVRGVGLAVTGQLSEAKTGSHGSQSVTDLPPVSHPRPDSTRHGGLVSYG
eukprot:scaffold487_cov344-Prasinococcus_capsulatus_cf.AAC.14